MENSIKKEEKTLFESNELDLLISDIKSKETVIREFYGNTNKLDYHNHRLGSHDIDQYYTCISGWNPVWFIAKKPLFDPKISQIAEQSKKDLSRQDLYIARDYMVDLHKCFSMKMYMLSLKFDPEMLNEDKLLIHLRHKIYKKRFTVDRIPYTK